jgi:hypothetical protein
LIRYEKISTKKNNAILLLSVEYSLNVNLELSTKDCAMPKNMPKKFATMSENPKYSIAKIIEEVKSVLRRPTSK